ncbi:MAG: hypothetical protein WD894_15595 [Pirellulales bacterium]
MFRVMKLMLAIAVVVALTAGTVMAQGFRDAGAKAAGRFGTGFHSGGMQSVRAYRSAPTYSVAPAPQVVQSMPAPMAAPPVPQIAQAPTDRRSFSAEPSQAQAAPLAPPAPRAAPAPQVIRSYSYEPSAPVYRAPTTTRGGAPSFLLPRTDPRKHGG